MLDSSAVIRGQNRNRSIFIRCLTASNPVISPNFMVWKFCGKAQFPHSFGRFARNYAETVPFHKFPHHEIRWNYCILRIVLKRVLWCTAKAEYVANNCFAKPSSCNDFCYGSIAYMVPDDSLSLLFFKCKYDVGNNTSISCTTVLITKISITLNV